MAPGMFARVNVRNPWLIAELLRGDHPADYTDVFMHSVVRSGGLPYVAGFVNSDQFAPEIFNLVFDYFDNPIVDALHSELISAEDRRAFCRRYIAEGGESFSREKSDGEFAKIVNAEPLLLEEDNHVQSERLKKGLRYLGYKAEALAHDRLDRTLLQFVLEEKRFVADAKVINELMVFAHRRERLLQLGTLVSEVFDLGDGPIFEVVSEDLGRFIESVVSTCSGSIHDRVAYIADILNNKAVAESTGLAYINKLEGVKIPSVASVDCAAYRKALITRRLVELTTENIVAYFADCNSTVDGSLCAFINGDNLPEDFTYERVDELGADSVQLAEGLICNEEMSANQVKDFLKHFELMFDYFDVESLNDEKLGAIISTCSLEMNAGLLNMIRECESGRSLEYALTDMSGYLALVLPDDDGSRECDFDEDEMLGIFVSDDVCCEDKLRLLSGFDGQVPLRHEYPEELQVAIVREHFSDSDLTVIPEYYDLATGESFKEELVELLATSVDSVIGEDVELGWPLASRVVRHLEQSREKRLRFVDWYCGSFADESDRENVKDLFAAADLSDYVKLIEGPSSMIQVSTLDNAMLETLSDLSMCGTISDNVNSEGLRRVSSKGYKRAAS